MSRYFSPDLKITHGARDRFSTGLNRIPYVTHYHNDGSGRDSYMYNNNGGFCFAYQPTIQGENSKFPTSPQRNAQLYPCLGQKYISYNTNGTGRDTYIAMSHGGFYPSKSFAEYKQTYIDQLRSYEQGVSTQPTRVYLQKRQKRGISQIYGAGNQRSGSGRREVQGVLKKDNLAVCNGFVTNQ